MPRQERQRGLVVLGHRVGAGGQAVLEAVDGGYAGEDLSAVEVVNRHPQIAGLAAGLRLADLRELPSADAGQSGLTQRDIRHRVREGIRNLQLKHMEVRK